MIDYDKSQGEELTIYNTEDQTFEMKTDLSGWVSKFLNGRKQIVDIAGPVKLPKPVADHFDMKNLLVTSTEEEPNDESINEMDSLEQILKRGGINEMPYLKMNQMFV